MDIRGTASNRQRWELGVSYILEMITGQAVLADASIRTVPDDDCWLDHPAQHDHVLGVFESNGKRVVSARGDAGAAVMSSFAATLKCLGLFGLTLVLALPFSQARAQAQSPSLLNFAAVGPGWRLATFPQQTMPVTVYSDTTESGRTALRMEARNSYSPLLKTLTPAAAVKQVRWSWRVGQQSSAIDLRSKAGDDASAKVCMSFVWPDDRVPFFERQILRLARTRCNPDLPAATLCWVWANAEQPGEMIENPYTRRVRSIVLRNSVQVGSGWLDEQRDVMKDLHLAFGDEWPAGAPEPLATAIFLAADADNTLSHSVAWIAGLRYE